jgi:hypothetical protein
MLFFKPENNHVVGVYEPSENFNKFIHIAVMDEETNELQASVGFLHDRNKTDIVAGIDDYQHWFSCIEQAKIYSAAPRMIQFLREMAEDNGNVAEFLEHILNIEEPVGRLLGKEALRVLDAMTPAAAPPLEQARNL